MSITSITPMAGIDQNSRKKKTRKELRVCRLQESRQ